MACGEKAPAQGIDFSSDVVLNPSESWRLSSDSGEKGALTGAGRVSPLRYRDGADPGPAPRMADCQHDGPEGSTAAWTLGLGSPLEGTLLCKHASQFLPLCDGSSDPSVFRQPRN